MAGINGNTITTANGLTIEFIEPGRTARVTYASSDGRPPSTSLPTRSPRCSPAATSCRARRHHHDLSREPGGSEQFMRVTGELVLDGERHAVDCHAPRDRSWRQIRVEKRGAVPVPPVGWSPMYFGA